MYPLLKRLLFLLPAETAHRLGMGALEILSRADRVSRRMNRRALAATRRKRVSLEVHCAGMRFEHPIALAAGLDKEAEAVGGLFALGFSGVEVGTVTPRAQPGNPLPRLFRIPEQQALINRMGFNNHGLHAMRDALLNQPFRAGPVGVNLGKNKDTPLERAVEDYVLGVERLAPLADYVVVNASSPNTPGLRTLQEPEQLTRLLHAVRARMDAVAPGKPLFLKFAPDLAPEAVDALVDVAIAERMDGLIATNTTIGRPFPHREAGGLSGRPLMGPSTETLRRAAQRSAGRLSLVGVGGVFTAADVYEKLKAGASLVQVYSGLIYEGPGMVRRLLEGLTELLERDGVTRVQDVVGTAQPSAVTR